MRDYRDEGLWASNRPLWKLNLWWRYNRFTVAIGLLIILYLLSSWFEEQDYRKETEAKTQTMALALMSMDCMSEQPAVRGYLIASDHPELADQALQEIVMKADSLRTARVIAQQTLKGKK